MNIFKEKSGVVSKDETWICICEGYLYTSDNLYDLIRILNNEWKHDKWLVG